MEPEQVLIGLLADCERRLRKDLEAAGLIAGPKDATKTKIEVSEDGWPTREEERRLSVQIVQLLDGLPVGAALYILEHRARAALLDGHRVDTSNERFKEISERRLS